MYELRRIVEPFKDDIQHGDDDDAASDAKQASQKTRHGATAHEYEDGHKQSRRKYHGFLLEKNIDFRNTQSPAVCPEMRNLFTSGGAPSKFQGMNIRLFCIRLSAHFCADEAASQAVLQPFSYSAS